MAIDERAKVIASIQNQRKQIALDRQYLSLLEAQAATIERMHLPLSLILRIGDARFNLMASLDAIEDTKATYLESFKKELHLVKAAIVHNPTQDLMVRKEILEREISLIESL